METPTDPAPPRRLRRWLLAGALLGAAAAVGVTLHWVRGQAARRAAAIASYDLNAAMDLAGAVVPTHIESFYFFVLEPDVDESGELANKLVQAAHEQDFLGIAGADAEHNRRVLRAALAIVQPGTLSGLVIIYVGPKNHEAELQPLIDAAGAQLRFVVYLPRELQTI
jgi:hypothetical protein